MSDRQLGAMVRQLAAQDPELRARLMPQEESPMAGKAVSVHYEIITARKGMAFRIPGIPVEKDRLLQVEGRPHAGGIDVTLDGGKVMTVPWGKIDAAIRTETEAA
jgi:hypothetical protein